MSVLFEPFKIGDVEFSNRIVMAPMTRARAGKERVPNEVMKEYYEQRSSAGLILTEAVVISEQANGWDQSPGIYTDDMVEGWKKIVQGVHEKGSKIFLQLWHCGRASHSSFHNGELSVAPSAIAIDEPYIHTPDGKQPHETPRALETQEIPAIVEDYRKAAERAKEAGFDGVEVHGANGYLLDQFMQSKTNKRTDKYGGSIEKRYQIVREVMDAILTVWPSKKVGIRLSPNGKYNDMGSADYGDQFTYVIKELGKLDLAYLHIMDGLGFGFHGLGEAMTLKEIREFYSGPLIGNVGYTKESAEKQISDGNADLIAFGRPFISNPDLVERFKKDAPLNEEASVSDWFAPQGSKGYTDFPIMSEA